MKPIAILLASLLLAACSSADSSAEATTDSAAEVAEAVATEAPTDPNAGTHRYRFVESVEHPENDCSTSAEVGKELTQETTFGDSLVTIVFIPDDLPEGAEPGRRELNEQLDSRRWREVQVTSDGATLEHTIEFTDSGIIMTTLRDGADCFYSVRDRIDG